MEKKVNNEEQAKICNDILEAVPENCPYCGSTLRTTSDFKHIYCDNNSCEGRIARKIEEMFKTLGIKEFGASTILTILQQHPKYKEDPLTILPIAGREWWRPIEWMDEMDILTEGMAIVKKRALDTIKVVPFWKLIVAFQFENCGEGTAKKIAKLFDSGNYTTYLDEEGHQEIYNLANNTAAMDIIDSWDEFLYFCEVFSKTREIEFSEKLANLGISICVTGGLSIPRKSWEAKVERYGVTFKKTITKDLTCLVKSDNKESKKTKNAKENGVPIYTEQEFLDLYKIRLV